MYISVLVAAGLCAAAFAVGAWVQHKIEEAKVCKLIERLHEAFAQRNIDAEINRLR
jgi:hypothetical protein